MILTWPRASWHTDENQNKRNIRQAMWGSGEGEQGCSGSAGGNGEMALKEDKKGMEEKKKTLILALDARV